MSGPTVYVSLSQFCEHDDRPRRVLLEAGFHLLENRSGRRLRREEVAGAVGNADAVLAGLEPYDETILATLPRLRCISRCGIGTDAIDLAVARERNVAVLTTIDEVAEPVAQMTVAMVLSLARNFPVHIAELHTGLWQRHTGHLLSEWTIGLVGYGRIGRTVERYLRPFGPRIVVADPRLGRDDIPEGVTLLGLYSLLAEADLVSIHADRRPEEGPLIGRKELEAMRVGSRLINTARGYLVDEGALYDSLQSGRLAGAALDVFQEEPYGGPLAALPQVLCTPHIGSLTRASRSAMELRCAENVVNFFKGAKEAT